MTERDETDTELLLNAYVDGELDAASSLAFDRRLAAEPELAAARDRLLALRGLLRDSIPVQAASERLRRAMLAQAGSSLFPDAPAGPGFLRAKLSSSRFAFPGRATPAWGAALAACLVGIMLGAGLTLGLQPRPESPAMAEVVADHLRAVMAPQPFDVASSDQHTVKPWFTGRLPFAPKVFDLAQAGFPLVGGRVDVVGGQPAAALVFRHGKHLISLISQPQGETSQASRRAAIRGDAQDRGFALRDWVTGGMHYWAVSDVAQEELDAFEAAARAQLAEAG